MRIGIDFDGVIIDTSQIKIWYCKDKFGITVPEALICGGGAKSLLTPEQYNELKDFDFGKGTLLGEVVPSARDVIVNLISEGHRIVIVTARHGAGAKTAVQFLKTHKIPYHHLIYLGDKKTYKGQKQEMTKRIALEATKLGALIDDQYDNLDVCSGSGAKLYLLDQPWNRTTKIRHADIQRVNGWNELYLLFHSQKLEAA